MDNRTPFNRDLLIPIVVGGLSVVGIIIVLFIGLSRNSPAEVPATPSETPFQYLYLGTEPANTTPLIEAPGEGSETAPPTDATPSFVTPTLSSGSISTPLILATNTTTNGILRTNTPNGLPTSTSTSSTAAASNTYDDTDSRLAYSGTWVSQTDVNEAHQGTLHVSTGIGDFVTFTFTGQDIHLFYQAGPSLGTIIITIDGVGPPPLDQSQSQTQIKEWDYHLETTGTHSIVVQHFGGGSVNIDSIVVLGATPTPTRTPTPTP